MFSLDDVHMMDDRGLCAKEAETPNTMTHHSGSYSTGTDADLQDVSGVTSYTGPPSDFDMDMDVLYKNQSSSSIDLTAILAEMSAYEIRLSQLSSSKLHDYPIGDALFLSHRFHETFLRFNTRASNNSASQLNTSSTPLVFSCLMTLTRTYSIIFEFLFEQLSSMIADHASHQCTDTAHAPFGSDIHLYRGLRLSQLQSLCICSAWNPAKKAVAMLVKSLCNTEDLLGLPPSLRTVAPTEARMHIKSKSETGNTTLFGDSATAMPTNNHLYKTIVAQAKQLRDQIEGAERLLKSWKLPCSHTPPSSPA
jgi:hypothetical protein